MDGDGDIRGQSVGTGSGCYFLIDGNILIGACDGVVAAFAQRPDLKKGIDLARGAYLDPGLGGGPETGLVHGVHGLGSELCFGDAGIGCHIYDFTAGAGIYTSFAQVRFCFGGASCPTGQGCS